MYWQSPKKRTISLNISLNLPVKRYQSPFHPIFIFIYIFTEQELDLEFDKDFAAKISLHFACHARAQAIGFKVQILYYKN